MLNTRRTARALLLATVAALATPATGRSQTQQAAGTSRPQKTGYVPANGVNYYYEIHGRGEPLLLLHGGLGSIDMFGPVLPALAKERQVIAVDLHGHGRTALGERAISLIDMGDDMATVLQQLGLRQVDVLGYSLTDCRNTDGSMGWHDIDWCGDSCGRNPP